MNADEGIGTLEEEQDESDDESKQEERGGATDVTSDESKPDSPEIPNTVVLH